MESTLAERYTIGGSRCLHKRPSRRPYEMREKLNNIKLYFYYHDASITQDRMDTKTSESFRQSKVSDYLKSTRAYGTCPKARTYKCGRQTTHED